MPRKAGVSTPKYCHHKASGQAYVNLRGKDVYLGRYNSSASKKEYDRLVAEWLAEGRPTVRTGDAASLTITELIRDYVRETKQTRNKRYLDDMKPAIAVLKELYGHTNVKDFGALSLKALRNKMVEKGWSRPYVNENTSRVKRLFKWGVSEEKVPTYVYDALRTVESLRLGQTTAPEPKPVRPVPLEDVKATLPHLPQVVADMVRIHQLTGARTTEVCIMRPCDIDCKDKVWIYVPSKHKTQHHGKQRTVFIGPQAQKILLPYLERESDAYCFSPQDSEAGRRQELTAQRTTPKSCGNTVGSNRVKKPQRKPSDKYDKSSYAKAVRRACENAGVTPWSPNRLRHSLATAVREKFTLDGAQAMLGHSNANVTQVYAELNLAKGKEIAAEMG